MDKLLKIMKNGKNTNHLSPPSFGASQSLVTNHQSLITSH